MFPYVYRVSTTSGVAAAAPPSSIFPWAKSSTKPISNETHSRPPLNMKRVGTPPPPTTAYTKGNPKLLDLLALPPLVVDLCLNRQDLAPEGFDLLVKKSDLALDRKQACPNLPDMDFENPYKKLSQQNRNESLPLLPLLGDLPTNTLWKMNVSGQFPELLTTTSEFPVAKLLVLGGKYTNPPETLVRRMANSKMVGVYPLSSYVAVGRVGGF